MSSSDGIHTHALLDRDAERNVARRLQLRLALLVLVMAIALGANIAFGEGGATSSSLGSTAIMSIVVLVTFALVYRRTLAHELAFWRSFRLAIGPHLVRRVAVGLAPLEVGRAQVAKMTVLPDRGLTLLGHDGKALLYVPEQLEGYAEVREELASWATAVETGKSPPITRRHAVQILISITLIASWFGTAVDDLRVAAFAGASLVLHIGALGWLTLREANLTARRKAAALIVFGIMGGGGVLQLAFRMLVSS